MKINMAVIQNKLSMNETPRHFRYKLVDDLVYQVDTLAYAIMKGNKPLVRSTLGKIMILTIRISSKSLLDVEELTMDAYKEEMQDE